MSEYTVKMLIMLCGLSLYRGAMSSPVLILTPLINQNRTEEARNASAVASKYFFNIKSYSGFLNVQEDANLFFWYFPSSNENVPWILWLQSELGLTSLTGLFTYNGPFYYYQNDSTFERIEFLKEREHSWTKQFSMVYLDNCVETGYSFGNALPRNEEMLSKQLLNAVQQLVQLYPELSTAPLYLSGEGYAGQFIPGLAVAIHEAKNHTASINLQGLILGNPILNAESILDYISVFLNFGLIDRQGAKVAKRFQDQYQKQVLEDRSSFNAFNFRENLIQYLETLCGKQQSFSALKEYKDYEFNYSFINYIMRTETAQTLHAGDISFLPIMNYEARNYMKSNFLTNVTEKIEKILDKYRILIYCGQLSLSAPYVPIAEYIRKTWYWNQRIDFLNAVRLPWWFNNNMAGYIKSGGNLMEVVILNTGDLVSVDKPEELLHVVTNFINNTESQFLFPPSYLIQDYNTILNDEPQKNEHRSKKRMFMITTLIIIVLITIIVFIAFSLIIMKLTTLYVYRSTQRVNVEL